MLYLDNKQKLFLKITVGSSDLKSSQPITQTCPIYVADRIPVDFSTLTEYFSVAPVLEVMLPFDEELKRRRGRGVALFSLTT